MCFVFVFMYFRFVFIAIKHTLSSCFIARDFFGRPPLFTSDVFVFCFPITSKNFENLFVTDIIIFLSFAVLTSSAFHEKVLQLLASVQLFQRVFSIKHRLTNLNPSGQTLDFSCGDTAYVVDLTSYHSVSVVPLNSRPPIHDYFDGRALHSLFNGKFLRK